FGTLVHAVLAVVDLDAGPEEVARVAALEGRLLGASAEETSAATGTVVRALAHPLVRRAASAGSCRRETPVAIRLDDGVVVEGVVDAAFPRRGWPRRSPARFLATSSSCCRRTCSSPAWPRSWSRTWHTSGRSRGRSCHGSCGWRW